MRLAASQLSVQFSPSAWARVGFGSSLGFIAIVLAMINVVGGFVVTHRMLSMFRKKG